MSMHNKRVRSSRAINIGAMVAAVLAHVAVIALVAVSFRYFKIEMKTFMSAVGAVICLLIIIDILFFVGYRYRERGFKVASIILSVLIILVGSVGSGVVLKINSTVNNVIDNSGKDQYEIVGGVFTYYKRNGSSKTYTDLADLKTVNNLKVGVLYDSGVGTGSLAKALLEKEKIDADVLSFSTIDDLLSALVDDESTIDVAVFPSSYRQRMENDENVDYGKYLERMVDFHSFEEKVKTGENENANKDLSTEPFNILLIGFAPENEAMTYGLADSIIVATVNPKSLTVVLTSIARDSYVPISCYGGSSDKINAARGTSRACLMETVGDVLDMEIDYYMEVNFLGVVEIVDAIGGIVVNNPVTFVGQSPSSTRGEYTVLVPAGEQVVCDGEMALAFARERHAMPNGDFDRQQHQQEVIAEIVRGLLELRDVNAALKVMEAAGNNISTNLSLSQLTGIFNYLLNVKSDTGYPIYNLIDIQNMRITGYSSWTYNYSMRLPLWIYKLYNGSIAEAKARIADVMNDYTPYTVQQDSHMRFFGNYPYNRGLLYSTYFNEAEIHEEMPAFYPYLTKYTYEQAISWAAANGVTLEIKFIPEDSPNYSQASHGMVIDQSPRQGALVSEYPVGSITVMGSMDPNYVPSYTVEGCNDEGSCIAFANAKGIKYAIENKIYNVENEHVDNSFAGTNFVNGDKIKKNETLIIYHWKYQQLVDIPAYTGDIEAYKAQLTALGLVPQVTVTKTDNQALDNTIETNPLVGTKVAVGATVTITLYEYEAPVVPPTPDPGGTTDPGSSDPGGSSGGNAGGEGNTGGEGGSGGEGNPGGGTGGEGGSGGEANPGADPSSPSSPE